MHNEKILHCGYGHRGGRRRTLRGGRNKREGPNSPENEGITLNLGWGRDYFQPHIIIIYYRPR